MDRRDVRIPTNRSVRLKFTDRQRFETLYMRDISKGGLFVKTPKPAAAGTQLTIVLDLPGETEITLTGEVAHVVKPGPGVEAKRVGMGVSLKALTPALQAAIEIYLKTVEEDFIDGAEDIDFDLPAPMPPVGPVADILEPPEPWELELLTAESEAARGAALIVFEPVVADPALEAPRPPAPPILPRTAPAAWPVLMGVPPASARAPTRPPPPPSPPRAAPPPPPPARAAPPPPIPAAAVPATPEELRVIEAALALAEPRLLARPPRNQSPNAYEVLGAKPADAVTHLESSYRRERKALDPEVWVGRLAGELHGRIQRAARALDAAWEALGNPEHRATLDLQLTVVPPPSSRTAEERAELFRKADEMQQKFHAAHSDRVSNANKLADGAAADIKGGRIGRARNALRLAISYDPLLTRLWLLLDEVDKADKADGGRPR